MRRELLDELVTAAQEVCNDAEEGGGSLVGEDLVFVVDGPIVLRLKAVVKAISDEVVEQIRGIQGAARNRLAVAVRMRIPKDYPVQPLAPAEVQRFKDTVRISTCGNCGLSWDDGKVTSMTPAPAARCPFEAFHDVGRD